MSRMHKAVDVLGLPVVSLDSGEEIGVVRDIFCDKQLRVVGVVLQEHTWLSPGKYVPTEHIHAVGEDYLTIDSKDAVASMCTIAKNETMSLVTGVCKLKGKPVVTERGEYLGRVEDVYFSKNWDKLVAYELSDGWITDVTVGRKRLPAELSFTFGKENIVVPDSTRIMA